MGKAIKNKSERNEGIDLLRIISMVMVVFLHVIGHGGILDATYGLTIKGEIAWFLEIACYCAVNCYALISGYVAYRANRKWRAFIYLWLQVLFYCVLINGIDTILTIKNGTDLGFKDVIKLLINTCLPVLTNKYWYFTAYTGLFVCMPILNVVIKNTKRSVLKTILITLILLLYVGERLFQASSFGFMDGYSFPWLCLIYVIGGYVAKYNSLSRFSIKKSLLYYFLCIVITFFARISLELVIYLYKGVVVKNSFESLIIAYTTPTIVLAATFLLNAFSRMKVNNKSAKIISLLSPLAFGVYIIHTHPVIFIKLQGAFAFVAEYNVLLMIVCIVGIVFAIYFICTIIEILRLLIFRLFRIKNLSIKVENFINKIWAKLSPKLGIGVNEECVNEKE